MAFAGRRNHYARTARTAAPKARMHSESLRKVAFAPFEATSRRTVKDVPFIRARGEITWRDQRLERTLMMFGELAAQTAAPILDGFTVVLEGRFKRVRQDDGRLGGEFFVAERIVNVLDAEGRPVTGDGTGRTIEGHYREGHYRRQHYGPRNSLVKEIWVEGTNVNGGLRAAA